MDLTSTVNSVLGQAWVLEEMNGQKMDAANYEMKGLPTLTFQSAEQIVGSTGCNNFSAKLKMSEDKLAIMPGPMTKMFCQGVDENGFMAALGSSDDVKVDGDMLTLMNGDQATLKFRKK